VTTLPVALVPSRRAFARNRYLAGLRSTKGIVGAAFVGVVVVLGVAAPLIVPSAPNAQLARAFLPASGGHLLGTDELGRDLFSRTLYGARVDLVISIVAIPLSAVAGVALGLLGGLAARAGTAVQRVFDVILAFPPLILGIAVAAIAGPGERTVILAIFLAELPVFGRLARGALMSHSQREYVVAARVVGASPFRILSRHILPNAIDTFVVQIAVAMSYAIFIEGGMSVVGLGVQPPQPSLGVLISGGLPYLSVNAYYVLGPIACIMLLVTGFNLIADALGDALLRR
jgi:peptide/nickel transport system permease protein